MRSLESGVILWGLLCFNWKTVAGNYELNHFKVTPILFEELGVVAFFLNEWSLVTNMDIHNYTGSMDIISRTYDIGRVCGVTNGKISALH